MLKPWYSFCSIGKILHWLVLVGQKRKQTNSHSQKGVSGECKKYYRGTRPKPRGKRQKKAIVVDFSDSIGEAVLFRRECVFSLGWLEHKICDGEYLVNSIAPGGGDGCKFTINADHRPMLLCDLVVGDLVRGAHVTFTWSSVRGEFLEFLNLMKFASAHMMTLF